MWFGAKIAGGIFLVLWVVVGIGLWLKHAMANSSPRETALIVSIIFSIAVGIFFAATWPEYHFLKKKE